MAVTAVFDSLEFELRRIPGVLSVGFIGDGQDLTVRLLAPAPADPDFVRKEARQLALTHLDQPVEIEIDDNVEPDEPVVAVPATSERVRLIAVTASPQGEEVEVHLSYGPLRTVGRAPSITVAGAVEATLAALDELGANVPFQVRAATPLGASLREVVVVVLDSDDDADGERLGVASGNQADEAAARATLHALNRFLSDPEVFPVIDLRDQRPR